MKKSLITIMHSNPVGIMLPRAMTNNFVVQKIVILADLYDSSVFLQNRLGIHNGRAKM